MLLIDESGSLKKTDPEAHRIDAALVAANGLRSLVDRSGGSLTAELQVARFGTDYFEVSPWIDLASDGTGGVNSAIDSLRSNNSALDTDYVNALEGAQRRIKERARALQSANAESNPCTAVLWFTDGKLDIEDRTNASRIKRGADESGESRFKDYAPEIDLTVAGGGEAARARGIDVLCRPGGVVDQFRAAETSILAIALTTELDPADEDQLRRIAAGAPGECGQTDGQSNGALFRAGDLSQLIGFFDSVVQTISNPADARSLETGVCPADQTACPEGTRTFDVDASLQRFHVLAQFGTPEIAVRLTAPGAPPIDVPRSGSGRLAAGETPINFVNLSAGTLTIDAESAPSGVNWAGTWSVTFVDTTGRNPQATNRATIYLFGDVVPSLSEATFRVGEDSPLSVELTREAGTPIPPDGFTGEVKVYATVTDPSTGEVQDLGLLAHSTDGKWNGTYRVPDDLEATTVNLGLRAEVTTAGGVALPPSASTVAVEVLPPAGFPAALTRRLTVGPILGTESQEAARTSVAFEGSDKSDTCVWLKSVELDQTPLEGLALVPAIDGAGSTEQDCLRIPQGESGSIAIELLPSAEARGHAHGRVVLASRSLNSNQVRTTELELDAELARPANRSLAVGLFALLMLLGVGVPIGVLYLANWSVAKFAPRKVMKACRVPVRVDHRTVERLDATTPSGELLVSDDFSPVGGAEPRAFDLSGLQFQSKTSVNPFQPPFGTASTSATAALFGSDRIRRYKDRARLGLSLAGEWVFVADPARTAELRRDESLGDQEVAGELIGFVPATSQERGLAQINLSVGQHLPNLAGQIADALADLVAEEKSTVSVNVTDSAAEADEVWGSTGGADPWTGSRSVPDPGATREGSGPPGVSKDPDDIWG